MKKKTMPTELCYILGLLIIAISVCLMEKADFGVSMVVAPAYVIYRKLSLLLPWFTFGMAEYLTQEILLFLLIFILRHAQISYLLSFLTAVIYGLILDGCMALTAFLPCNFLWQRILYFLLGAPLGAAGVSLIFHSYLSPEVYELFVKEISRFHHFDIHKVKTVYDICSAVSAFILSIIFFGFGEFVGINFGTVICALANGWLISRFTVIYEKTFEFKDFLPWRDFFLKGEKEI